MWKIDPKDAFFNAILRGILERRKLPPGGVIERMSDEEREALSKLTSDESKKIGWRDAHLLVDAVRRR